MGWNGKMEGLSMMLGGLLWGGGWGGGGVRGWGYCMSGEGEDKTIV